MTDCWEQRLLWCLLSFSGLHDPVGALWEGMGEWVRESGELMELRWPHHTSRSCFLEHSFHDLHPNKSCESHREGKFNLNLIGTDKHSFGDFICCTLAKDTVCIWQKLIKFRGLLRPINTDFIHKIEGVSWSSYFFLI